MGNLVNNEKESICIYVMLVPDLVRCAVKIRKIWRRYPVPGICSSHTQNSRALLPEVSHFPRLLI